MITMAAGIRASGICLVVSCGAALAPGLAAGQSQARERGGTVPHWTVAPDAQVVLGVRDGPPELLLLNPTSAAVLSDGAIVVADITRNYFSLRVYDAMGALRSSCGRFGQGPFEFVLLTAVARLPGDSVMIPSYDHRFSVFGPGCEKARSGRFQIPPGLRPNIPVDRGHLLLYSARATDVGKRGHHGYYSLYLLDEARESVDTLVTLDNGQWATGQGGLFLHYPLQGRAHWAVGGGRVWYGNGSERVVTGRAPETHAVQTVPLDLPRRPVGSSEMERWKAWDLGSAQGQERRDIEEHHRNLEAPDSFPVFQDLHVDATGRLWVLEYARPWSRGDYVWHVIAPSGATVATVSVPFEVQGPEARVREFSHSILDIEKDYILVRVKDDLGVPYVKKHMIVEGSR